MKIEHLQNGISELECKERDAQIELQKVRVELTTALWEEKKVLSQLREKFHIEEKAKMELEILLEEEKTQRAQEATEHANILRSLSEDKERKAKEEAQHAEEREKMMRDEAQHAWDESDQDRGLLEVEKNLERRLAELQVKKLEKELQDLALKKNARDESKQNKGLVEGEKIYYIKEWGTVCVNYFIKYSSTL